MDSWKAGYPSGDLSRAKRQQEVIAEAERMIADAKQRLEDGLNDLKALMVHFGGCYGTDYKEAMDSEITSEDKSKAETVIQEGEATLRG